MKSKNTQHVGAQLAVTLLTLLSGNAKDRREGKRRIKALGFTDHVALMRVIINFDLAVFDCAATKWRDSEYWGRGVNFPADESKAQRALPGRRAGD